MIPPITFTLAVSSDALMALDSVAMAIEKLADAIKEAYGADPVPVAVAAEPEKPKATQAEPRAIKAPSADPPENAAQASATFKRPSVPAVHLSPWTDERRAVLRREYPRGTPLIEIEKMILALPGTPPASRDAIGIQASHLGLRRPGNKFPAPKVLVVPVPPRPPVLEPQAEMENLARVSAAFADDAVPVDYETILGWADGQRMPFRSGDDLRAINAKRIEFALPPFKLSPRWSP